MQKPLENYLEAADGAAKIMAHAKLLTKLARLYQSIAPSHLCQGSVLANYKSGIIVIHANSGAVAAKLRQLAPSLTEAFSRKGVECNGVQVKVQAPEKPRQFNTSTPKPLSAATGKTLVDLHAHIGDSPLKAALDSLLKHAAIKE